MTELKQGDRVSVTFETTVESATQNTVTILDTAHGRKTFYRSEVAKIKPPREALPKNIGAVIKSRSGTHYTRVANNIWWCDDGGDVYDDTVLDYDWDYVILSRGVED